MAFLLKTAPIATSRFSPKNLRKIMYQSRLHEGDTYLAEAAECLVHFHGAINTSERLGWKMQFDRLRADRGRLAEFSFYSRSYSAQADALSRAEEYGINAKMLYDAVHKRRASMQGKHAVRTKPRRTSRSGSSSGNSSLSSNNRHIPTSQLATFSTVAVGDAYSTTRLSPQARKTSSSQMSAGRSLTGGYSPSPRYLETVGVFAPTRLFTESPEPILDIYDRNLC